MKKVCPLLVWLGLLFWISGCETLKTYIKSPRVTLDQVALKDAALFQGTLEFTFDVSNPNPVGLRLDEITYQLTMDGKTVIDGTKAQRLMLPGMGSNKATLPLTVNYMESAGSLFDLFTKKSLPYEVSGSFKVGIFTIPFRHKGQIALPKPPTVSVSGLHVVSMGLTGAKLMLTLEVVNDNPCSLVLKTMGYELTLGGFRVMDGQTENIVLSEDQKIRNINVPVSLNFMSLGKGVMALLDQGNINYEISGDMLFEIPKIGSKSFRYKKSGQVDLTR
jgi:LEA14-like dessication related protein